MTLPQVKYVTWYQSDYYLREITSHGSTLLGQYTEASIALYTQTVEEGVRSSAIELAREAAHPPFGMSLLQALREKSYLWQERRDHPSARAAAPLEEERSRALKPAHGRPLKK